MTPNKHYEVLESVEILGAVREVGTVLELAEADAKPFVEAGALKEHGENSAPEGGSAPVNPEGVPPTGGESGAATPDAPQVDPTPAPGSPAPEEKAPPAGTLAPAKAEEQKGWVGNHTVGGNEANPHKGGGLRTPHPDLAGKKA